jgi:hypothetical protein
VRNVNAISASTTPGTANVKTCPSTINATQPKNAAPSTSAAASLVHGEQFGRIRWIRGSRDFLARVQVLTWWCPGTGGNLLNLALHHHVGKKPPRHEHDREESDGQGGARPRTRKDRRQPPPLLLAAASRCPQQQGYNEQSRFRRPVHENALEVPRLPHGIRLARVAGSGTSSPVCPCSQAELANDADLRLSPPQPRLMRRRLQACSRRETPATAYALTPMYLFRETFPTPNETFFETFHEWR